MNLICSQWSEEHIHLGKKLRNPLYFEQNRAALLELHAALHRSTVSGMDKPNSIDTFFAALSTRDFAALPSAKGSSIAWHIWHLARIEDATMNLLVKPGSQVFDARWQRRMGAPVTDTGNAMTREEIRAFSDAIKAEELLAYRDEVGKRSRSIVNSLEACHMKLKVDRNDLEQLHRQGCLAEHENSLWLLDFWGKKDIAGLFLMPLTRHQTMHLKDCEKAAENLKKTRGAARP